MDTPLAPDHPFASRNSGEQAGRDRAADEGEYGDDRDGEPDRQEGRGGVSADDQTRDRRKEQQVHQVHSERAFGQGGDEPRRGLAADAGEHEEQAVKPASSKAAIRTDLNRCISILVKSVSRLGVVPACKIICSANCTTKRMFQSMHGMLH